MWVKLDGRRASVIDRRLRKDWGRCIWYRNAPPEIQISTLVTPRQRLWAEMHEFLEFAFQDNKRTLLLSHTVLDRLARDIAVALYKRGYRLVRPK